MRLLELPQRAQEMVGDGTIALSGVDQLRAIGQVSPALLDAVIDYLSDGNEWAAERLCREPGWVLDAALRRGGGKVFAAHLTHLDAYEIAGLKLGQKTAALVEEAAGLHKQIDRYAYGAPTLRFTEQDVDQARGWPSRRSPAASSSCASRPPRSPPRRKPAARTPASVRIRSRRPGARSSASSQSRGTASTSISVSACSMACRSWTRQIFAWRASSSTGCWALTTTARPTPRPATASPASRCRGSAWSSRSSAPIRPRRSKTGRAAGCGSTTATPATPSRRSSGCGSSSTRPRPPQSSTAERSSSSAPSSTPRGSWSRPASGHTRRPGRHTRITPPRP